MYKKDALFLVISIFYMIIFYIKSINNLLDKEVAE